MVQNEMDVLSSLFHLPAAMTITSIHSSASELVIRVRCTSPTMACPVCHQPSERIHGAYQRTVADLPCAGRNVILLLTVRKFVCSVSTCPQKIFTERIPGLVASYARMTTRLLALVQTIGVVVGGELGARLAERLGITIPASTLLLHLMKLSPPTVPPVRVLGVDDWSWKKGRRYGAILVDLERHTIIDLLADRSSETFARWLRTHPEVEIISRDRGTEFAAAARAAAPQARQIADRFHLIHNLSETLETLLARCRTEIRRANQETLPEDQPLPEKQTPSLPLSQTWCLPPSSRAERIYEAHRAEREDRYRQIAALREQAMTYTAIAQRVGVSAYKVRSWLKQGGAPIHRRPQGHDSLFDPYAAYVLDQWRAGVQEGKHLYEEIRQQGYRGSLRLVRAFLQPLREHPTRAVELVAPSPVEQFCARDAVWLFIHEKSKLTAEEQEELLHIRTASATIETTYGLVQQFLTMVRKRLGAQLDTWIEAVQASQIPELSRFVNGILQDKDAVVAGLSEVYSNGQTEGQVHKLKLVKRSMYGRAKLPLLRQRLVNRI